MVVMLATRNPGKVREYTRLLAPLSIEVRSLAELPGYEAPEETGETFEDNAVLKALHAARAAGLPALADDSGLCVDALDGAPGVRSARYASGTDEDRCQALLAALDGVPTSARTATFQCVIALAKPDGEAGTVHGRCTGRILHGPRGQGGFGYDPLFQPDGQSSTFAQLAPGTKDSISHRGRAVAQLPALLGPALRLASADSVV